MATDSGGVSMGEPVHPSKRIGIYKDIESIPKERRLHQYSAEYDGEDIWETFLTTHLFEKFDSERFVEDARRAGRRWKAHMEKRGRHHALATPKDIEAWCDELLDDLKVKTAYNSYWVRVERFYKWLYWHRDHPHCYNPVLMAAANGGAAGVVWEEKIGRWDER